MADVNDPSRRIVFTGAAGGIGTMIRPLLRGSTLAWC